MNLQQLVVMGPSGSGKTLIGTALAAELGLEFIDADSLHSPESVERMAAGIPLTDADRLPWLDLVGARLRDQPRSVLACSALARRYRDRIRQWAPRARFVELLVSVPELERRMLDREHFMPASLLESQLEAYEPRDHEEPGVTVLNEGSVATVVSVSIAALRANR